MIRFFTPLFAVLLTIGAADGADAKKLTLRWHGQSFFDLETPQGTRIVFDPHAIEAYGRITVSADMILVSHLHDDHTQIQVVQLKKNDAIKKPILSGLKPLSRFKTEWETIDEKITLKGEEIKIRTVGTYHDTMQGMESGKNAVFIVEIFGLRFVHLGDLGHVLTKEQVEKIGPVDVLMIPIGGVYTLNGNQAKRVVAQLKPRQYIVPMHYGTKVFDDLLPPTEFLEDQKKERIRVEKTNQLVISTDFKPTEPDIVLLQWTGK
jgi:L-ascorbate metabolism protein UlaG (beta-lactamase superfamily)